MHVDDVARRGNRDAERRSRHTVCLSALDFDLYQVVHPVSSRTTEDFAHDTVGDQDSVVPGGRPGILAYGGGTPQNQNDSGRDDGP